MNKSTLEELSKEDLIKAIYGADIHKIVLNNIWQEKAAEKKEGRKLSVEVIKNRWRAYDRIKKAISPPTLSLFLAGFFPLSIVGLCFLYLRARDLNHHIDMTLFMFTVIILFSSVSALWVSAADSRMNKTNSKLEALIALLHKSEVIKE